MKAFEENPLVAQHAINKAIAGLEKFQTRGAAMLAKKAPSLPAETYPLKIKRVKPRWGYEQAPVPEAFLLIVAAWDGLKRKFEVHPHIGTTQEGFNESFLVVDKTPVTPLMEFLEEITLVRWGGQKLKMVNPTYGFAQIYPVSAEVAEKAHLFDVRIAGLDLELTPKENLLAAESESWFIELRDFGGSVFHIAKGYVEVLRNSGWEISPLKFKPIKQYEVYLDIDAVLIDLHKTQTELTQEMAQRAQKKRTAAVRPNAGGQTNYRG